MILLIVNMEKTDEILKNVEKNPSHVFIGNFGFGNINRPGVHAAFSTAADKFFVQKRAPASPK